MKNNSAPSSRTASSLLQQDEPFFLVSSRRKISQQIEKQCSAETPTVLSKIVMTPLGQELVDCDWCDEVTVIMPARTAAELRVAAGSAVHSSSSSRTNITKPSMKRIGENSRVTRPDPVIEVVVLNKE